MGKWLNRILAAPELIAAFAMLKADIEAASRDESLKGAVLSLRSDPKIATTIDRISAEWRAVEEAVQKMR